MITSASFQSTVIVLASEEEHEGEVSEETVVKEDCGNVQSVWEGEVFICAWRTSLAARRAACLIRSFAAWPEATRRGQVGGLSSRRCGILSGITCEEGIK